MTLTPASIPGYTTGTWVADPAHSEITFSVRHLAISKVKGGFEKFTVSAVTAENPLDTKVTATIDVSSVNTGNEQRDGHLRTSDFFALDEHPTIEFASTSIRTEGDDIVIEGDLTMRGVTKPTTFTGEFGGIAVNGYGITVAGGSVSTKVNRHDFGVSWNAVVEAGGITLGDDVTITIDAQLALQE